MAAFPIANAPREWSTLLCTFCVARYCHYNQTTTKPRDGSASFTVKNTGSWQLLLQVGNGDTVVPKTLLDQQPEVADGRLKLEKQVSPGHYDISDYQKSVRLLAKGL